MIKNSVYNKYKNLDDKKFKEAVGIPKILFEIIVPVLSEKVNELHKGGGRIPNLCIEDSLLMTLKHYREYPTFSSLGLTFGIDKSNAFIILVRRKNIQLKFN